MDSAWDESSSPGAGVRRADVGVGPDATALIHMLEQSFRIMRWTFWCRTLRTFRLGWTGSRRRLTSSPRHRKPTAPDCAVRKARSVRYGAGGSGTGVPSSLIDKLW